MIRILFSLFFALVIGVTFMTDIHAYDGHQKWLSERIIEAHSIKPGVASASISTLESGNGF
jgi:hypothetical protein